MATVTRTVLIDDLDGSEASETVEIAIDKQSYEIDLSPANAERLREKLSKFVDAASPVKGSRIVTAKRVRKIGSDRVQQAGRPGNQGVGDEGRLASQRTWPDREGSPRRLRRQVVQLLHFAVLRTRLPRHSSWSGPALHGSTDDVPALVAHDVNRDRLVLIADLQGALEFCACDHRDVWRTFDSTHLFDCVATWLRSGQDKFDTSSNLSSIVTTIEVELMRAELVCPKDQRLIGLCWSLPY